MVHPSYAQLVELLDEKDRQIADQGRQIAENLRQIARLEARVAELEGLVARLEAQNQRLTQLLEQSQRTNKRAGRAVFPGTPQG